MAAPIADDGLRASARPDLERDDEVDGSNMTDGP